MRFGKCSLVTATVGLLALGSATARASLLFSVQQVGSDVVVTGSGTAITSGLSIFFLSSFTNAIISTGGDALIVGPSVPTLADEYNGITGPSNFGSGTYAAATSGTGQRFGLDSAGSTLYLAVPSGYTSGTPLAGTDTYSNLTFARLRITPGTYLYTFGAGATADSLTIQVGPAAPPPTVPEPGSIALLAGMGTVGAAFLRRRKQARKAG